MVTDLTVNTKENPSHVDHTMGDGNEARYHETIHEAVSYNRFEIAEYLISNGADISRLRAQRATMKLQHSGWLW